MSEYGVTVTWQRNGARFTDQRYRRGHLWQFDCGVTVPASASPLHVPLPYSDPAAVDPEEAFVAALSSCHMLTFLYLAARAGWVVESYTDAAVGCMEKTAEGKRAITRVTLRPKIAFEGPEPSPEAIAEMHHEAHEGCYIAASVKTEIAVE